MSFTFEQFLNESTEATPLNESSLTRIQSKIEDSRCATLSAFRNENGKKINRANSAKLASLIKEHGFSYTQIVGHYVEEDKDGKEVPVKELSFFVQNKEGESDADFDKAISEISASFKQECVLIIPKGGKDAFLLGTLNKEDAWLSKGEKFKVGNGTYGKITAQCYSKINGRPFEFKTVE